ncbi:MAG: dihydrolipoyl dehydrogenase [Nitrospinae bacterium]|nr:dihydrolipoyl dehydrogenase [Nitrospinota bacterium]
MESFDIAVIGAGPGGYSAALRGAALGLSVSIVEKGEIGGVCLNTGCVPAKSWVAAAETVDFAKAMGQFAAEPFSYTIDFAKMAARQRAIVAQFRKAVTVALEKAGVKIFHGEGRFVSPSAMFVGDAKIGFKNAVIAAGSIPARLFDFDPALLLDNTSIFDLESAPKSILIIGGGAIGCEMAGVMSRLGAEVTIVEAMRRILPMEDAEVADTLSREFRKRKINVITGSGVAKLEKSGEMIVATLKDGKTVTAEKALVSVGRKYATAALGLDKAGVATGARGDIPSDEFGRTSVDNIFAVGDVAGKNLLAYTAYKEGILAAEVIAGKNPQAPVKTAIPSVVFTIPEIGSVGVTEDSAPAGHKKGIFLFRALARAHAAGEIAGFVKIIADGTTDKLLGVHIIGPRATDMVHTACIAMACGLTAQKFGEMAFAHPTFAEAMMEAAHDVHGVSIHK